MEMIKQVWNASILGRAIGALCSWTGRQWRASAVVGWFVQEEKQGEAVSRASVFYRLWNAVLGLIARLYEALHLEKLFAGSLFAHSLLWCGAVLVLAPLLPTMLVLALAAAAFATTALRMVRRRDWQLSYSRINRYVLLYALIYLCAIATSVTPGGSLYHGVLMVFFILFVFVVENNITTWTGAENVIFLMVLSGGLVAIIGMGQYVLGVSGASAWIDSDMFGDMTRVYSTLQNPNVLAEYLILMIPLGGAVLLGSRDTFKRAASFVCCGLMCVCMILTLSRGGWLGLLLAGVIFLVLLQPRLILLAPFALIALYFVLPDTVINRFASIGDLKDGSTSYRVSIWMGTLAMLKDGYWLCGVGPGTAAFNLVYPAYSYNTASAQHGHNLYLQILCDGGAIALVVFLLTILAFSRAICGALSRAKDWRKKCFLIAPLAGVGGFLGQSMTDYTFYNYRVALLFWAVLGLGAAIARISDREEVESA